MLPGVIHHGDLFGVHMVIFHDLAFGKFRDRHDFSGLFGNGRILHTVPDSAGAAAQVGIKIRACFIAHIMHHGNALVPTVEHGNNVAHAQPAAPALCQISAIHPLPAKNAAGLRQGDHLDIAVFGNNTIRRNRYFQLAGFQHGVHGSEYFPRIALDAGKLLYKKRTVYCILGHFHSPYKRHRVTASGCRIGICTAKCVARFHPVSAGGWYHPAQLPARRYRHRQGRWASAAGLHRPAAP